ncbi:MAG: 2-hydroxyacyl-CoA dehydratase family protein [Planctomycetota bacterium]
MSDAARAVGITTSVPVEVLLAAGAAPVDLNNRFVASGRAAERVKLAERRGFPPNVCAWVKGLYGTVLEEGIRTVVGVTQGDCSLTHALLEVLQTEGVEVVSFGFPYSREEGALDREIARFERRFGVSRAESENAREGLASLRRDLAEVDRRMGEGMGAGLAARAHALLLSGSDFGGGAPDDFASKVKSFLREAGPVASGGRRGAGRAPIRLALAGIPPIVDDLFEHIERLGARVVLTEMAREFAMVRPSGSIVSQYLAYTYPYDIFHRLKELAGEAAGRSALGIVHYVQSFCFRGVHDRLLREKVAVPVLTLECDRPGRLDGRSVTRLEAFIETLGEGRASRADGTAVE